MAQGRTANKQDLEIRGIFPRLHVRFAGTRKWFETTLLVIHGLSSALNLGTAFCLNNDIAPQYPVEIDGKRKNMPKFAIT